MSQFIDSMNAVQKRAAEANRPVNNNTALWIVLWSSIFFVFLTNEVLPIAGYPLFQNYRLQLVADRYKLLPLAIFGSLALLVGPLLLSTRVRQEYAERSWLLGGVYYISVICAAIMALILSWDQPLLPAIAVQVAVWLVCTAMAFRAERNNQIARHREWMMRSYAVTFTFVSLRILGLWPAYWNLSDASNMVVMIVAVLVSLLAVDIGISWNEAAAKISKSR